MKKRTESRIYMIVGRMTLLSVTFIVFLHFFFGSVLIDLYESECQPFTSSGIDVKENSPRFKAFLNRIKDHNGILVLGTSETNAFVNENYLAILNKHFESERKFSYLAGAGRSAHIYFPTLLNNKDEFEDLEILYFINPTYWRLGMNRFYPDYYERYNSRTEVIKVKSELEELGLYEDFAGPMFTGMKQKELFKMEIASMFEPLRRSYLPFFQWAGSFMSYNPFSTNSSGACVQPFEAALKDTIDLSRLRKEIDPKTNSTAKYGFVADSVFYQIDSADYQYRALSGFISMCRLMNVKLTFFLGPYNEIYCENTNPEYVDAHDEVLMGILQLLADEKVDFIDGSDLSYLPGSFNDKQHHSKYAAWIMAERIAQHYEKNR